MPRLLYAMVCNDIIVDRETGATSFIRTIEHAVVPELPVTLPPLYVGTMWEMEKNDTFSVALQLLAPSGKMETLGVQDVKDTGTMLHKLNFQLPGIPVAAEGRHMLVISIRTDSEWESVQELPIFIFKESAQKKATS
ncbi:hypothetical protein [Pseudodesulfovibrio senegalensis]|jgi:hypothetical protein|uniref:Uncharacterized protein n=1 Tax=Pseudodesulfovibrio senegalensis TaxID=1721087 RepID=A0A6N6N536_9BACT|nr:hypothetical protein [Pseudodesulfovibrio senegalensis]KAB1441851.1 hypothetical protein F8A88_09705 [Pseudodesulfovibrio senegalensis]